MSRIRRHVLASAVALGSAAATLAAPPEFQVTELAAPGEHFYPLGFREGVGVIGAVGENPNTHEAFHMHAVLRTPDGQLVDLRPNDAVVRSTPMDLNASGRVVGVGLLSGVNLYHDLVFLHTPGEGVVDLGIDALGGAYAEPLSGANNLFINDHGDIAGTWIVYNTSIHRAFLHTQDDGWVDLGPLLPNNPSGDARVVGLTEDRRVLMTTGSADAPAFYDVATGEVTAVPEETSWHETLRLNAAGQFTGYASFDGESRAFLGTEAGLVNLDPAGTLGPSRGFVVTPAGHVVGHHEVGVGHQRLFRWTPEDGLLVRPLDTLAGDATFVQPRFANDHGTILGVVLTEQWAPIVFIDDPVLGPQTLQDLVDPDQSHHVVDSNLGPAGLDQDGRMLVHARRAADDVHVGLLVEPVQGALPAQIVEIVVIDGTHVAGTRDDVFFLDGTHFQARSEFGFSASEPNVVDMVVLALSAVDDPELIDLIVVTELNHPNGTTKLRLREFPQGSFQTVGTFPVGVDEAIHEVHDIPAEGLFRPGDGRIDLSIRQVVPATFSALGFDSFVDLVRVETE